MSKIGPFLLRPGAASPAASLRAIAASLFHRRRTGEYERRVRAAADRMVADAMDDPSIFSDLLDQTPEERRDFFQATVMASANRLNTEIAEQPAVAKRRATMLGGTLLIHQATQ